MKKLLLITAAMALVATSAFAGTPGCNLSWAKCPTLATSGTNFTNACDGAQGLKSVTASFRASHAISDFAGIDAVIDIGLFTANSPYWAVETGGCAAGAVTAGIAGVQAGTCPTGLYDASTFSALAFERPNPSRLRVRLSQVNGGAAAAVVAGTLYQGAVLNLDSDAGSACAGCADPACLVLNNLTVSGFNTSEVESIETADIRNYATYNGGAIGGSGCPAATPSHNSTWGQVKSLYRN